MENRKNIVLVPTDFTEVIEYAIEHAAGICKILNYKLTLIHVINKDTKSFLKKENLTLSSINERLDKKTKEISEEYGIISDFVAREGSIFTTIGAVANELGANLVVLGTHGKLGLQHITGSYALKVIESSPAPVIVVQKRGFREGYKKILLPIDDTSESKQKVKWAIHIARKYESVVYIYGMHSSDSSRMAQIKGNMQQIQKFFDQNEISYIEAYAKQSTSFPKQLLIYAEKINADLILIMTNPDKILPSVIVGKWEEEILFNDLLIPTMAINPVELNIVVGGF